MLCSKPSHSLSPVIQHSSSVSLTVAQRLQGQLHCRSLLHQARVQNPAGNLALEQLFVAAAAELWQQVGVAADPSQAAHHQFSWEHHTAAGAADQGKAALLLVHAC